MRPTTLNPFGLTLGQVDVMDAMCKLGRQEAVAESLRISTHTVKAQLNLVFEKMGLGGPSSAVVAASRWSAWRATDGKGVPA